ncbi:MAG: SRPBCC family protein [Alphaproteobacteria bacterium]
MSVITTSADYGVLTDEKTLEIQRRLPGPIDRVWSYLVDGEKRSKWLASGDMEPRAGTAFTLTWRNDELTDPPGARPDGFSDEHSMASRIVEFEPPHKLTFTWGDSGEVTFLLKEAGQGVLLTVIHRGLPDRNMTLMVGPGWHIHLDVLRSKLSGETPEPFWDGWVRLRSEYERRIPA